MIKKAQHDLSAALFCYFVTLTNISPIPDNLVERIMKCHRVNELIELLHPEWQKDPDLNLMQFIVKLAAESGFQGKLEDLTDDVLIYHLKMRNSAADDMIPGLAKDQEDDFKTALLKARGIIK